MNDTAVAFSPLSTGAHKIATEAPAKVIARNLNFYYGANKTLKDVNPPMATSNSSTCGHPKILHLTRS
jgi:hypothetical protein